VTRSRLNTSKSWRTSRKAITGGTTVQAEKESPLKSRRILGLNKGSTKGQYLESRSISRNIPILRISRKFRRDKNLKICYNR
jgi:hypothetical protein